MLLIITSFIYVIIPEPVSYEKVHEQYYDVVFLVGDVFSYSNYSISVAFNETLSLITTRLNLTYKMFQQDFFPLIRAKVVILFSHGNSKSTVLFTKQYSNSETTIWLQKTTANFFISESCFSSRFLDLPSNINVLASSLFEESRVVLRINETENGTFISAEINRSLLFFFLQVFSFNFNNIFSSIVDLFAATISIINQTIWMRFNGQLLTQNV